MNTAEEILNKHHQLHSKGMESISTKHFPLAYKEAAYDAMKEVAIEFGKWMDVHAVRNGVDAWTIGAGSSMIRLTTLECYEKFLKEAK